MSKTATVQIYQLLELSKVSKYFSASLFAQRTIIMHVTAYPHIQYIIYLQFLYIIFDE